MVHSLVSRFVMVLSIVVASVGAFAQGRIIAADAAGTLWEINQFTGALTFIAPIGGVGTPQGMAYDRVNDVLYLSTSAGRLYRVNYHNGLLQGIGSYGLGLDLQGLEYDDRTHRLFAADRASSKLLNIDKGTAMPTVIGPTGVPGSLNLGYQSNMDELFMTSDATLRLYRVNRATGGNAVVGPLGGLQSPQALAFNWQANRMFLVDSFFDIFFEVDVATGNTIPIGPMGASDIRAMAYVFPTPTEQLVTIDSSRAYASLDMNTGAKTPMGTASANASTTAGLAYDRDRDILWLTSTGNDSLYTLNLTTGAATLIGAYGDPLVVMHGLEYDDSTGKLFGDTSHNNGLYSLNQSTGLATLIGTSGLTSFTNLGYDSNNDVMYATNSGTDSFYRMDRSTGMTTLIGALGGPTNPNGLAYDWTRGRMFMVDNTTDNLYTINLATGAATVVGSTGAGNLLGLAYMRPVRHLRGRVILNDYLPSPLGRLVRIEVSPAGDALPIETHYVALDSFSQFDIRSETLSPGTYDIYAKASHWNRRVIGGVTVTATGASGLIFSLDNGDVDNDNEVSIGDYAELSIAYGTLLGDPGFNAEADLNGDDEVGISDYAILSSNYGLIGD